MTILLLVLLAVETIPLTLGRRAEVVGHLSLSSTGSQPALATVRLGSGTTQQVALWAGTEIHTYSVFLGAVPTGSHQVTIENARVHSARFQESDDVVVAHAPILYARTDTAGTFNDVPMLSYCEKLPGNVLEYTVIFSNEDGGTSTRALMARWGRTTDIEFIYRVWLDGPGAP